MDTVYFENVLTIRTSHELRDSVYWNVLVVNNQRKYYQRFDTDDF